MTNNLIEIIKEETGLMRKKISKNLSDMIQYVLWDPQNYKEAGDTTMSKDLKQIRIRLNVRLFRAYFEEVSLEETRQFIRVVIRHETFHAFQWAWVSLKYGYHGIDKMRSYINNHPYETSILEKGAKDYENEKTFVVQDFEKDLKIFA